MTRVPKLIDRLVLDRCPHCGIFKPLLQHIGHLPTPYRQWKNYQCSACGNIVLASSPAGNGEIDHCYPSHDSPSPVIPERAREYLKQAQESLAQPVASIMVSASRLRKNSTLSAGFA